MRITQLGPNEEPRFTKQEVDFKNLSGADQRVFEELVAADEPPVYQNVSALTGIERKVVTYQGGRYETSGLTAHDCEAEGLVLMYMGISTALGGVGLVASPYLWRGGTQLLASLRR
ncbi:hypothetical protein [Haladaptatus sp. ZSTT2]|uniref:hypothetical protein n=1 Tax=Haladaptatus sp. ZSTT2 TaxID=3120515 RepID=UPI00300ECD7E